MATVPVELYELFEEKLGKEKTKEAVELVEEALKSKKLLTSEGLVLLL